MIKEQLNLKTYSKSLNKHIFCCQGRFKVSSFSFGFTLAEILITLSIIGVVAAITIPLIHKVNVDRENKVAYRKAFAAASQAISLARANNNITSPCANGNVCNNDNFNAMKDDFKIIKDCNSSNASLCWDMTGEKAMNNTYPSNTAYAFVDSAGMSWATMDGPATGYFQFLVDTNGFRKPNQFGTDRWVLMIDFQSASNPIKVSAYVDQATNVNTCPSLPICYYSSYLDNNQ